MMNLKVKQINFASKSVEEDALIDTLAWVKLNALTLEIRFLRFGTVCSSRLMSNGEAIRKVHSEANVEQQRIEIEREREP